MIDGVILEVQAAVLTCHEVAVEVIAIVTGAQGSLCYINAELCDNILLTTLNLLSIYILQLLSKGKTLAAFIISLKVSFIFSPDLCEVLCTSLSLSLCLCCLWIS